MADRNSKLPTPKQLDLEDQFQQFVRNGRWGSCGDCPRGRDGRVYPEFCVNTDRDDHNLDFEDLASSFRFEATDFRKRQGR